MQFKRGRTGSALIMVMLVVAGITTIIFATQRIALVQFSQSVREEDNLMADFAARAGIEDGLVRYRFERNTETSKDKKFRFNLTKATFPSSSNEVPYEIDSDVAIEDGVDGDYDPNYQYYDSVISYKTQRINVESNGEFSFTSASAIEKDDTLTLTGFPSSGSSGYFLRYGIKFDSTCTDIDKAFVTLQQVVTAASGASSPAQQTARYTQSLSDDIYDSREIASNMQINVPGVSTVSSVVIRAFHCPVQYAFATTTKNDGQGNSSDFGPEFDSLKTEILSTGYFGSTKRTLIAQVDRRTGNLLGIFDFILYSGGNTGISRRGF